MNFYRNSYRNMNRFFCCLALSVMTTMGIYAQNGTNSPYSMYGLGDLADQGVGFNKAMSGTGLAFRKGNEVNPLNPASYSAVDSLSMIIDAGLSGQITNYNDCCQKQVMHLSVSFYYNYYISQAISATPLFHKLFPDSL